MIDSTIYVGKLKLNNRLVMPPMHTGRSDRGHVTDDMVSYYRERALLSKPGIIITEHSFIAESGRAAETQLSMADDEMIAEHRRLTDAIHEGGCLAFVQLNHAGSFGIGERVSASNVNVPRKAEMEAPRELTVQEIAEIENLFAEAAGRSVEAGYDGVEIHCAHAYLLNQFYSPITNKRTDEYGGSLENRLRFLLETVEKVRVVTGPDVPIAVRLGGADYMEGGSTEEDAAEASKLMEKAGVDMIDISGGMCFFARPDHIEPGYFASMTERIKKEVSIPVLLTGGIKKVSEAEELLKEGKADLIGVGRALLADANWRKNS